MLKLHTCDTKLHTITLSNFTSLLSPHFSLLPLSSYFLPHLLILFLHSFHSPSLIRMECALSRVFVVVKLKLLQKNKNNSTQFSIIHFISSQNLIKIHHHTNEFSSTYHIFLKLIQSNHKKINKKTLKSSITHQNPQQPPFIFTSFNLKFKITIEGALRSIQGLKSIIKFQYFTKKEMTQKILPITNLFF